MLKIKTYLQLISPQSRLDQIFVLIFGLGILHIILGLLAWLWQIESLRTLGFGSLSFLVLGLLPVILSFGVKKCNYLALGFVVLIYALDAGISVYTLFVSEEFVIYLLIKILILMFVLRGFKVIYTLKKGPLK